MAAGKKWVPEELLVALNVYHKLTFGQLHSRNPVIIDLAETAIGALNTMPKADQLQSLLVQSSFTREKFVTNFTKAPKRSQA